MTHESRYILLIGFGNSLRRDDGAGRLLAAKLESLWSGTGQPVRLLDVHELAPELALDIAAEEVGAVVFVDAAADPSPQIRVQLLLPAAAEIPFTHQFSPAALLFYAERLYARRPPAWLVTVPGFDFAHGDALSPQAAGLLADVQPLAAHLLAQIGL